MPGMRVVGIFNRRFDAELAVARLHAAGIEAVVIGDTNPETGSLSLAAQGFEVAVRREIAVDAADVLGYEPEADAEPAREFRHRPGWIRYATYAILAAMAGPILFAALIEAEWLIEGLFP